ncbi:VacB/RNase II family 3'-5' exoribonuclease [Alphaproteobacteria bacterium]|nr:VacB/RNase II family 3'-5' exoribonuclease [Alphaproteobacteria bacterium]
MIPYHEEKGHMPLANHLNKQTNTPSKEELIAYLKSLRYTPDKQEICKHFHVKGGAEKIALKGILKELIKEGVYARPRKSKKPNEATAKKKFSSQIEIGDEEGSVYIGQVSKTPHGVEFIPTFKKAKQIFKISEESLGKEIIGKIFKAKIVKKSPPTVELIDEIGTIENISLTSAHMFGLPMDFSKDTLEACKGLKVPEIGKREDLRPTPLVTIDGADSRDFDDAVWAEPDTDPNNSGGWHLIVAIADVAHYVIPDSEIDKEALNRGTSTYFPDYVIPMLPEALSNDLCSLRPEEDRACMGVHLWITKEGKKIRHKFFRGLMKSAARLTYEQAQKIHEGEASPVKGVVAHLYGAYEALDKGRRTRGTLEVDSIDPYIVIDNEGAIQDFIIKERMDSHRLIEEFMILANVSAAEFLEENKVPTLFRVHDKPNPEKIEELRRTLRLFKIKYNGSLEQPGDFTKLLESLKDSDYKNIVNELVLRCQSQAIYSTENMGHFGLNLKHYSHFTSPIRRYPDLLVHRGILSILGYKEDGLSENNLKGMDFLGDDTSSKERRAEGAERDAMDRYMTHYLSPRTGEYFNVYVSGINKAGLFVTIPKMGASGLVPMNRLGDDYYIYLENPTRLEGRRTRQKFSFGDTLKVKLLDADLIKGRLTFELDSGGNNRSKKGGKGPKKRRY